MVQDFRGFNTLLEYQSGGLDDIDHLLDEMEGSTCLFSINLASGFLQLEINEDHRHLTAFRDADGKLWEYVRCGFALKIVPSAFTNYVGGQLMEVKSKGIKTWLGDIAVPSMFISEHWELLRVTL